jgi:hypothetical protein
MAEAEVNSAPGQIIIGWQEWAVLPELAIPAIKVKIDTGACTSALHASDIEITHHRGNQIIHFMVTPLKKSDQIQCRCQAKLIDERWVMSSTGHKEKRYVINTPITLAGRTWEIEVSLTNRDPMRFRMLLGRTALNHVLIDPKRTLLLGKLKQSQLKKIYTL